jgi:polyisoprenoid-binding protein YceI
MYVSKKFCTVAAAAFLLSCTVPKPHSPGPSSGSPAADQPATRGPLTGMPAAGTYRIDSSGSELRLLVYRAGALANLGHNHVILNRAMNGTIVVAPMFADSSLSFSAPIAAFSVDDAQARREEGEDFPGEIPDDAKSGTMTNMTGPALLNAAQHPLISVRSLRLAQSHGALTATLAVSVAGHESTLTAPFGLTADRNSLSVTASFELRQTALGLTPFSLLLGALAVRDAMQVKLRLVAVMQTQH